MFIDPELGSYSSPVLAEEEGIYLQNTRKKHYICHAECLSESPGYFTGAQESSGLTSFTEHMDRAGEGKAQFFLCSISGSQVLSLTA